MTQEEIFEESFKRPHNYFTLPAKDQWSIDRMLGILDWEGGNLSPEDTRRFKRHYDKRIQGVDS